jgi:hypothetical protein
MLRNVVCTVLAFCLFVTAGLAADEAKKKKKKKATGTSGEIVTVDADKGTLTVKVAIKKKQTEDREFKVTDKTTVTVVEGNQKTQLKGDRVADLLKKEQFKTGARLSVEAEEDGKTLKAITFGEAAKKKKKKTNDDK